MILTIQKNISGEWHVSGYGVSDEPLDHPDWYDSEGGDISEAVSEYEELRDQYRNPIIQRLWIIAAAVGIILIITAVTIIHQIE